MKFFLKNNAFSCVDSGFKSRTQRTVKAAVAAFVDGTPTLPVST